MTCVQLTSDRLVLDALRGSDAERLCEIASQPAIADNMISVPSPFGLAEAAAWIERFGADGRERGWAIRLRGNPATMIGFVGLGHLDAEHGQAEISFWIDSAHAGEGIVTEATAMVIGHGFSAMSLARVEAYHMCRNPASAHVLKKLGFRKEGLLRSRVRKKGRREDVLLWAMIAEDREAEGAR